MYRCHYWRSGIVLALLLLESACSPLLTQGRRIFTLTSTQLTSSRTTHILSLSLIHSAVSHPNSPRATHPSRPQTGSSPPSAGSSGPGPRLRGPSRANQQGGLCVTNSFSRHRVGARVSLVAVGVPPMFPDASTRPVPNHAPRKGEPGPTRDSGVGVTCGCIRCPRSLRYQPQ